MLTKTPTFQLKRDLSSAGGTIPMQNTNFQSFIIFNEFFSARQHLGKKRLDAIKNKIDGNIKFNTLLENLKLFFEELNYSI